MLLARTDLEAREEGGSLPFLSVDIANTRPIFRNETKKAEFLIGFIILNILP